jgi:hypothetical protein
MILNDHIARLTAAFAAGIAVLAWLGFGADTGLGAVVGGALAVVNVSLMRFIARRLMSGVIRDQRSAAFLLSGKLAAMAVVCWIVIARLHVDALGFALGTGALLFGLFVGYGRAETAQAAVGEES